MGPLDIVFVLFQQARLVMIEPKGLGALNVSSEIDVVLMISISDRAARELRIDPKSRELVS